MSDDPSHPIWPAFESQKTVPPKSWIVLYEGLSGNWLASSPFYHKENAMKLGSSFDRGVRILEMTVTKMDELSYQDRLPYRTPVKKVRKVAKIRRIAE
jgi:hypothetical protein